MNPPAGPPGAAALPPQRTLFGHPLGLYVLFFTEMWERFNYYGMRALLMLYMINWFKWSQKDASTVYKVFTSFVYITPILGGFLADRFLGNKWAVVIGALVMALGQLLMTSETLPVFYVALALLIVGNGFFKPNMSTQVGRLYAADDGRRDGAYTIFYMGVNLGALLAPIVCGLLAANTVGGYRSGFLAAGLGMIVGLVVYLLGQPLIRELPPGTRLSDRPASAAPAASAALSEKEAERVPSALGTASAFVPAALAGLGLVFLALAPALWYFDRLDQWNAVMLVIAGGSLVLLGHVARTVAGGLRDRVLAILVLAVFVIFFWAAFEQAGNVQNLWADKNTDRYLTEAAPPPSAAGPAAEAEDPSAAFPDQSTPTGYLGSTLGLFRLKPRPTGEPERSWGESLTAAVNPVPTAWFQSVNAAAIVLLAPVLAWVWLALDRRGWQPSIPAKMVLGLVLMSLSMAVMVAAARREDRPSQVTLAADLPSGLTADREGRLGPQTEEGPWQPFHAGRLTHDPAAHTLTVQGVLPDTELDHILTHTAPASYRKAVAALAEQSRAEDAAFPVEVRLDPAPAALDLRAAGLSPRTVQYRPADGTLAALKPLAERDVQGLLVAGADPGFRSSLAALYGRSQDSLVSPWWLIWSYIIATVGELCLSPVGLSMVSKLAPARFATMLMGVWYLTSAIGNFAAGTLGEVWGTVSPTRFFVLATAFTAAAALVLLVLVRLVRSLMHGVR